MSKFSSCGRANTVKKDTSPLKLTCSSSRFVCQSVCFCRLTACYMVHLVAACKSTNNPIHVPLFKDFLLHKLKCRPVLGLLFILFSNLICQVNSCKGK